jgi:hypothetical protein
MWVLGSLSYTVTFLIGFYRWLQADHAPSRRPALTT